MLRFLILFLLCSWLPLSSFAEPERQLTLSLDEAILLAVRENPFVQTSELNHVLQKFALAVERWQFQPHFLFQASASTSHTVTWGDNVTTSGYEITPAVSLVTPIGTKFALASNNKVSNHFNPGVSLQIMQPLIRGFGRPIVEMALYNAIDSEKISHLNIQGTLRSTVTAVINAYLDVASAENTVKVDEAALKRAHESVQQTKLFIKAGHKAGVELVTVQADAASAEMHLENDKNNLQQMRYALLTAIGIDPNTHVVFSDLNVPQLIKKYHVPSLEQSRQLILENDIQYQTDQIMLAGSLKRSVLRAEDNLRWQLDLTVNAGVGNAVGGGGNAGVNSLFNQTHQSGSAMLNLSIPIDDRTGKQALAGAKIALREACIALKYEKWTKETSVINSWNTIGSAERALHFAESAAALQQKTYKISFQKYSFGLIDSLELQTAQQQLISAEQALVIAEVNYLKSLVGLDLLTGNTLKTWNVAVHYG